MNKCIYVNQGRTNPGGQVAVATKFCAAAINTCGPSARNLLHVTLLVHRILRVFIIFFLENLCTPYFIHIVTFSGTDPRLRMNGSTHMLLLVTSWCVSVNKNLGRT